MANLLLNLSLRRRRRKYFLACAGKEGNSERKLSLCTTNPQKDDWMHEFSKRHLLPAIDKVGRMRIVGYVR